ncbi:MAG TPA: ATP-dependent Clp protease ATP-binding subunit [Methanocella sp.]|uniref:ATP-dependent Clp protease ATP-binding subunit n=1 Tax=Methanocella sp. TaxID=2052833 RepID=UPI002C8A4F79|nr:ATP-dependent Clp protease ATP-binding subunit [Methanocella sp.]HTY91621.1 ATP-dependent Clp protease ATP-binding subunit [Methanocella sp.]
MDTLKLTAGASKAWDIAAEEAARSKGSVIEKEHLFIGLMSLDKAMDTADSEPIRAERDAIQNVLDGACDRPSPAASIRRSVRMAVGSGDRPGESRVLHRSDECKALFRRAGGLSYVKGEVSCLHLLAAVLESPGPAVEAALSGAGIAPSDLMEPVYAWIAILEGGDKSYQRSMERKEISSAVNDWLGPKRDGYLLKYGRDLTGDALKNKLGPFSGRKKELLQLIQVLGRRAKNNPVLVGEAGVGKTAIVEALAVRIARGKDAHVLGGKRIIQISMASLVANTKYRGDLEERLTGVLDEAIADPAVILFIDEIHTIVGAGRSDSSALDASNILKPYLVRGLRCIGTSTIAEYHRYIEADPALERRFETILVEEPCREEALDMLEVLRPRLEEHHGVRILDEAVEAAVDLSMRFDAEHMLPDKAVDLLDMACSGARIPSLSMGSMEEPRKQVDSKVVAETLADSIGLPIGLVAAHLEGPSTSRLLGLEGFLKSRIAGQEEAVGRISRRLMVAYSGIEKRRGPLAVFLFTGPTGVGKTETARLLAEFLFGSSSEMIRLDLSEYSEDNSVAKLIGSPPGYVGYEEDGLLVRMLRARPYTVALFDEVEKASPRVFDVFLQLFDEGRITDSRGRTADARNTIFILTSNLEPGGGASYEEMEEGVKRRPRKKGLDVFRPELVNRIDEIVAFRPLDVAAVKRLLRKTLDETLAELERTHHVTLRLSEGAENFMASAGYSPEYGARELRRVVRQFVYVPLSRLILTGEIKAHRRWLAVYDENGISIVPDET